MIEAINDGRLKALYIKGEDTITSDSNAADVGDAFRKLDFFIVQDVNFSETCQYADLVLPASPSLEKDGTFTSTERRIQRLYKALDPLGESKPDWVILQLIAQKLGGAGGWNYKHPSDVMVEVARLAPLFAGVTYERLEGYQDPSSGQCTRTAPTARSSSKTSSPSPTARPSSTRSSTWRLPKK